MAPLPCHTSASKQRTSTSHQPRRCRGWCAPHAHLVCARAATAAPRRPSLQAAGCGCQWGMQMQSLHTLLPDRFERVGGLAGHSGRCGKRWQQVTGHHGGRPIGCARAGCERRPPRRHQGCKGIGAQRACQRGLLAPPQETRLQPAAPHRAHGHCREPGRARRRRLIDSNSAQGHREAHTARRSPSTRPATSRYSCQGPSSR